MKHLHFDKYHRIKQLIRQLFKNLYYLANTDLSDKFYETKDGAVEDSFYEFEQNKRLLKSLPVLSQEDSLSKLESFPKSFVRFGDGEIDIIQGKDCPFQSYDPVLSLRLLDILSSDRNDIYIGINRSYFQSAFGFIERNHRFYREHNTEYRRFFVSNCNSDVQYLDACCFGAYLRYEESFDYERHYQRLRNLISGRNIALVAGYGIIEKLEYQFFDVASDIIRINAPCINAFDEYDQLLSNIQNEVPINYLVCIILGQTATVLAADLAEKGYLAWDMGHIAKEYDAYRRGMDKSKENLDKFWAPD